MIYTFWNNKGGTGKTSIAFQTITEYALTNKEKKILVIDLCPQANLSELLMGGLIGEGGSNLANLSKHNKCQTIGGYFQERLTSPYSMPSSIDTLSFIVSPNNVNQKIPSNIDLLAGDRIVELQSNSISALSITQIPGVDSYIKVIDWINDFIYSINQNNNYDQIFIDTNPSFAIYTQIALAATERLIVPVMADDSSRRAFANILSLVYGLNLPSTIYNQYSFNNKIKVSGRQLPKIHIIVKNRLTQYMGPASAYASVLSSIENDLSSVLKSNSEYFTFSELNEGLVNIRDFQTTGVVAFAEAIPFSLLTTGKHNLFGNDTQIQKENIDKCLESIKKIVDKL